MTFKPRPLRIMYITDTLIPGGTESQLVDLILNLDRTHISPVVLCLYGVRAQRNPYFASILQSAGVPVYQLDMGWGALDKVLAVFKIAHFIKQHRPDLIQMENYHANLLTRLARLLAPAYKLIGTVRYTPTLKQLIYECLGAWLCTAIVTNAPQLREQLIAFGISSKRLHYIPNSVDLERFGKAENPAIRDEYPFAEHPLYLTVGRISAEKNIHLIVAAFGLLKRQNRLPAHVRLMIVGHVQEEAMQVLIDEVVARDGLGEIVIQLPEVRDLERYYYGSDITILFSPAEGLPNVVLESLASGRPVIISKPANASRVINSSIGWVVETYDAVALSEVIYQTLCLSPESLEQISRACREVAREYSLEKLVSRYTDLYHFLLAT